MSKLQVYYYPKCGTCRNALKWLKENEREMELYDLFEQAPSEGIIRGWLEKSGLELKKFFNTSGEVYKEMKLKDKLPKMSEDEQIKLLASNGRLIKRPVVSDGEQVTVGFKEDEYSRVWSASGK
ncbi:arsenate reductase family protein [Paenibacillus abyssi]|uniref:Arsenate reductase n=1 Tax=Paenibacillus abyssi TaxID=1340531 RepID=A0A917FSC2_9BACL|nr:arsenate reductase family protein [Paenibacillus abyssi]GGF99327.1 hypothetical protein GCM10010916_15760 [Paenibacillus abyssi]